MLFDLTFNVIIEGESESKHAVLCPGEEDIIFQLQTFMKYLNQMREMEGDAHSPNNQGELTTEV